MSPLAYAATSIGGILIFYLIHYVAHRLAHWTGFSSAYAAHADGHHKVYDNDTLVMPVYQYVRNHSRIRYVLGIPIVLFLFAVLPLPAFLVILAEALLLGPLTLWFHVSVHITDHWVTRSAFGREVRRLHFIHHHDMRANYGFPFMIFDRLFRTFRDDAVPQHRE